MVGAWCRLPQFQTDGERDGKPPEHIQAGSSDEVAETGKRKAADTIWEHGMKLLKVVICPGCHRDSTVRRGLKQPAGKVSPI